MRSTFDLLVSKIHRAEIFLSSSYCSSSCSLFHGGKIVERLQNVRDWKDPLLVFTELTTDTLSHLNIVRYAQIFLLYTLHIPVHFNFFHLLHHPFCLLHNILSKFSNFIVQFCVNQIFLLRNKELTCVYL